MSKSLHKQFENWVFFLFLRAWVCC